MDVACVPRWSKLVLRDSALSLSWYNLASSYDEKPLAVSSAAHSTWSNPFVCLSRPDMPCAGAELLSLIYSLYCLRSV